MALVLGIGILTSALLGFSGMHHDTVDPNACAAVCLQAVRPIVTEALLIVALLLLIFFEAAGDLNFHTHVFSRPIGDAPGIRFRQKFTHWFSLLEHSPTA